MADRGATFTHIRVTALDVDGACCHWCGGVALNVVVRRSVLSGAVYGDAACGNCSKGWLPDRVEVSHA